mmetsp:Transcript_256/g.852  ORF Transcript_256/g.852 Transcript_256/m.852 type:complete len:462 (+) Transcript_256:31-1416(+)
MQSPMAHKRSPAARWAMPDPYPLGLMATLEHRTKPRRARRARHQLLWRHEVVLGAATLALAFDRHSAHGLLQGSSARCLEPQPVDTASARCDNLVGPGALQPTRRVATQPPASASVRRFAAHARVRTTPSLLRPCPDVAPVSDPDLAQKGQRRGRWARAAPTRFGARRGVRFLLQALAADLPPVAAPQPLLIRPRVGPTAAVAFETCPWRIKRLAPSAAALAAPIPVLVRPCRLVVAIGSAIIVRLTPRAGRCSRRNSSLNITLLWALPRFVVMRPVVSGPAARALVVATPVLVVRRPVVIPSFNLTPAIEPSRRAAVARRREEQGASGEDEERDAAASSTRAGARAKAAAMVGLGPVDDKVSGTVSDKAEATLQDVVTPTTSQEPHPRHFVVVIVVVIGVVDLPVVMTPPAIAHASAALLDARVQGLLQSQLGGAHLVKAVPGPPRHRHPRNTHRKTPSR